MINDTRFQSTEKQLRKYLRKRYELVSASKIYDHTTDRTIIISKDTKGIITRRKTSKRGQDKVKMVLRYDLVGIGETLNKPPLPPKKIERDYKMKELFGK